MNQRMRLVALAGLLFGLPGCNMVVSEKPWFTEAEAEPVPVLRDGLWLRADADCRVDQTKPAERWPDCADASFVRGDEHWSMDWDDIDGRGRHRRTFAGWELADLFFGGLLVANGDHLIVQAHARDALGERAPSQADTAADQQEPQGYLYGALRLIEHDGDGKVIAMESWPVQCGPLPEEDPSTLMGGNVTDRPFAGLTVVDDNCLAESADAVRSAATLSEVLRPLNRMRWVREGWR